MWPGQDIQRRWTWDDVLAIRAMLSRGVTMREVAKKYGKSHTRIRQVLKAAERYRKPNFDGRRISTRLKNRLELADCWTVAAAAEHSLQWWLEQPDFDKACAIEFAELVGDRLFKKDLGTLAQCLRARNAELKRRCRDERP